MRQRQLILILAVIALYPALLASPAQASHAPGAPTNDHFADAIDLVGPAGTVSGTTVGATWDVNEPCMQQCAPSVWYRWTPPASTTFASFDLCLSTFDTTIQVFKDGTAGGLLEVARDDDGCGSVQSRVDINVVPGVVYYLRVAGYDEFAVGPFQLIYPAGGPLPSADPAAELSEAIEELDLGTRQQTLLAFLEAADDYVADGEYEDATDKLRDLIDKLEDYVENGTLDPEVGNELIELTEDYIAHVDSL